MKIYILASGSKGNSTLIVNDNHLLLIDLGLSHKRLIEKLDEIGYSFEQIEAFIFTHDHTDHIGGVDKNVDLSKCYTAKGNLDIPCENELRYYQSYKIASFDITVLPTSHDATNPIGFIIKDQNESLMYMTDTGYVSSANFEYMKDATYYIIESNHDYKMLMQTKRPESLKLRIISDYGHLCNEDSAEVISHLVGNNTKSIILAHLSEEANTPEKALAVYKNIFARNMVSLENINLQCANQWETLKVGE